MAMHEFAAEAENSVDGMAKVRERLLCRCAVIASYCSAKKKIHAQSRAVCWTEGYGKLFGKTEAGALRAIGTKRGRVVCALFVCKNRVHVVTEKSTYDVVALDGMFKTFFSFADSWLALDCFFQKKLERLMA